MAEANGMVALVPVPRVNLTRFHGVFASNSKYRAQVTLSKRGKRAWRPKANYGQSFSTTDIAFILPILAENLTNNQESKLAELLQYNLRSIRSYLLKEEFQLFWQYVSPYWAGVFLDKWCTKTMRSKIEPMKKVAKMLKRHRSLLLNWFRVKNSSTVAL
jgi:transposase